jgi:hypothetical protein
MSHRASANFQVPGGCNIVGFTGNATMHSRVTLTGRNGTTATVATNGQACSNGSVSGPALFNTTVGAEFSVFAYLDAVASSFFGTSSSSAFNGIPWVADASHSLALFIDPVGTGFSYRTASGFSYVTPTSAPVPPSVPEPATGALLLAALVALKSGERRRRGRSRAPRL